PIGQAVLPEVATGCRVDGTQAAVAAHAADSRAAPGDVQSGSIPGAGRDAALPGLRSVPTNRDAVLPDRTGAEICLVERVVDAVLVRHADQSVDRAVDRCRERGWGVDEVAVRRLLRRWNLPRAHQRQVRGAQ